MTAATLAIIAFAIGYRTAKRHAQKPPPCGQCEEMTGRLIEAYTALRRARIDAEAHEVTAIAFCRAALRERGRAAELRRDNVALLEARMREGT